MYVRGGLKMRRTNQRTNHGGLSTISDKIRTAYIKLTQFKDEVTITYLYCWSVAEVLSAIWIAITITFYDMMELVFT